MITVLVGTSRGCRVFSDDGERTAELEGRSVSALTCDENGAPLAVVDGREIWRRRRAMGDWSLVAAADVPLASVTSHGRKLFAGARDEAAIFRAEPTGKLERLSGFERTPGRSEWFPQGPPLHVRALTAATDGSILAAVHVGGIPRSVDGGETWETTLPVAHDVHEVRAHPSFPVVAAAAAVGLCLSEDYGRSWRTMAPDAAAPGESLAVAVLYDEVLFSVQEGGAFAERSQIWRWKLGALRVEPVSDGLPEWLKGKVDTNHLAAGSRRAALVDQGGQLWISKAGSTGWKLAARYIPDALGVVVL